MTTISKPFTTELPSLTRSVGRAAGIVARRAMALLNTVMHRREVRGMLELDERTLRDIGLTRNDVLGALAEPLLYDPSAVLMVRTVERRARLRLLSAAADARAAARGR